MQYINYPGKHELCCRICDCLLGHGTGAILCGMLVIIRDPTLNRNNEFIL